MDLAPRGKACAPPPLAQEAFETATEHFELPEGARAFAKQLVTGVAAELKQLDQTLAEHATHWRVERMSTVDRNVLRLAVYELQHSETPVEVVIDEAVELARCFGTERSPAFVNGVLDGILRARGRGPGPSPES
jgi:N utilization substance protein B